MAWRHNLQSEPEVWIFLFFLILLPGTWVRFSFLWVFGILWSALFSIAISYSVEQFALTNCYWPSGWKAFLYRAKEHLPSCRPGCKTSVPVGCPVDAFVRTPGIIVSVHKSKERKKFLIVCFSKFKEIWLWVEVIFRSTLKVCVQEFIYETFDSSSM